MYIIFIRLAHKKQPYYLRKDDVTQKNMQPTPHTHFNDAIKQLTLKLYIRQLTKHASQR